MASAQLSPRAMTPVKTYGTRLEADLASILLRAEGIMAAVVGVGLAMSVFWERNSTRERRCCAT
jgi:hypothetical protein